MRYECTADFNQTLLILSRKIKRRDCWLLIETIGVLLIADCNTSRSWQILTNSLMMVWKCGTNDDEEKGLKCEVFFSQNMVSISELLVAINYMMASQSTTAWIYHLLHIEVRAPKWNEEERLRQIVVRPSLPIKKRIAICNRQTIYIYCWE